MDERKKILEMLSNGKITVAEAESLLAAVGAGAGAGATEAEKKNPKFLRVEVKNAEENVNVRVPFSLLRAGVKLVNLMPLSIRHQVQNGLESSGINLDLSKVKAEDLDEIVTQLADLQVDVEGKDKVKIYVE